MILSVYDRLLLLNVLPKEGDITALKIVRKLKDELSFSEDEHSALQFKHEDGNILWKEEADISKEIEIGEKANDVIVDALRKLNKAKKLTEAHLDLYERFVKDEGAA
jgi:hypothetical protein